jgi:uncharacterized protein with PIN domain
MESLTEKARKRHLRNGGSRCPYCKADDINLSYEEVSFVEEGIEQKVICDKCKRCWVDIFHLVDIRELGV